MRNTRNSDGVSRQQKRGNATTSHFAETSQSENCEVVARASSLLLAAKKAAKPTSQTSHRVQT
jgi:hypothetical protein